MKQSSNQPINDFVSQMQTIWDQLALAELTWENAKDVEKYFKFCGNLRVLHFLMALTHDYEPVRALILQRGFLPTLEGVVSELLSEETRLSILKDHPIGINMNKNSVFAINSSKSDVTYNYYR